MIADIIVPAEMLMEPVDVIVRKLPKEFRRWINDLPAKPTLAEMSNILKPGLRHLNFNYTEFLESLYDVLLYMAIEEIPKIFWLLVMRKIIVIFLRLREGYLITKIQI